MVQEPGAVERMHIGLLRRGLRWRCKEVSYFLHAFRKVQLRLLSQAVAVSFRSIEEFGVNVEEGVVSLVLCCGLLA